VAAKPGETAAGGRRPDFEAQNQAMRVNWSTNSRNYLPKPDLEWDAAPMPKGMARSRSMHGYNPLAIATPSRQVDAAWALIGHLTGPCVVRTWTENARIMATRKSAAEQAKFIDALPPGYQRIARQVTPLMEAIARSEKSVPYAALEMKRLADPLLRAG